MTRIMFFIDGDNLLARFQAMKEQGYVPQERVAYRKDCFVWSRNITVPVAHHPKVAPMLLQRAYYYCSVVGDDEKIASVVDEIKKLDAMYETNAGTFGGLYPKVFKKETQKSKASGVDVQLAVDALSHIYNDNMDTLCIVSGDGDFIPVVQEAIRHGKHVYVAALSSGLNLKWKRMADVFHDLDGTLFDLSAGKP